jgi:hypothetical protein
MLNHSNFWYVTFYPLHENLILEIKLIQGVVRGLLFSRSSLLFFSFSFKLLIPLTTYVFMGNVFFPNGFTCV